MSDAERRYNKAMDRALISLRFLVGHYRVCPVCFLDNLIENLEEIRDHYSHNETVNPMTLEEMEMELSAQDADANAEEILRGLVELWMTKPEGSA